jgi:hypothetical protein
VAGPAAAVQVVNATLAGNVGAPADSVAARVVDSHGNPVANATVAWEVLSGGGTVSAATSTTNAAGIAKTQWTLGPVVGTTQQLVVKLGGTVAGTYTATASVAPGAVIVTPVGDGQAAQVFTALPQAPGVKVTLPDGRAVVGLAVHFPGGDVATNAQGVATQPFTLPKQSGPASLVVTPAGLGAVTLHFTAIPGPGVAVYGDDILGASHPAGTTITAPINVYDAYGNLTPYGQVTWTVIEGGGSVSPGVSNSNAAGVASTQWTLGPKATPFQVLLAQLGDSKIYLSTSVN